MDFLPSCSLGDLQQGRRQRVARLRTWEWEHPLSAHLFLLAGGLCLHLELISLTPSIQKPPEHDFFMLQFS